MKKLFVYFVQGLLVTVPVAITIFVVYSIINWISDLFSVFGTIVSPIIDPLIFILIAVVIILLMGMLGSSIILKPIFSLLENAIEHTPFIKTIYSSIKDILSAFVGNKRSFDKPVLLVINKENNIKQLGFITREDLSGLSISKGTVAVYVPLSYSLSGNTLIVPTENIIPIDAKSTEVMKFIVSGGVTEIN
jgi:uncharacterized membrane protein